MRKAALLWPLRTPACTHSWRFLVGIILLYLFLLLLPAFTFIHFVVLGLVIFFVEICWIRSQGSLWMTWPSSQMPKRKGSWAVLMTWTRSWTAVNFPVASLYPMMGGCFWQLQVLDGILHGGTSMDSQLVPLLDMDVTISHNSNCHIAAEVSTNTRS